MELPSLPNCKYHMMGREGGHPLSYVITPYSSCHLQLLVVAYGAEVEGGALETAEPEYLRDVEAAYGVVFHPYLEGHLDDLFLYHGAQHDQLLGCVPSKPFQRLTMCPSFHQ